MGPTWRNCCSPKVTVSSARGVTARKLERRFRWMVRQVVATVDETQRVGDAKRPKREAAFVQARLEAMQHALTA